jgi:hypothetical protein
MGASNKWRRWLVAFGALLVVLVGGVFAYQTRVDPLGVWGAEEIAGYNNFKVPQGGTERVFKIYQYLEAEPEVAFWGSSRLNYCTPTSWPDVADDKVFNFGIDAVHIPEQKYYYDAAMARHRPRVVVFGVDLLQFSQRFNDPREGFSEERLSMVALSPVTAFLYKARETVMSYDAFKLSLDTIEASEKAPKERYYINGWNSRGENRRTGPSRKYRHLLWKYHRGTYRKFRWSKGNWKLFRELVEWTREQGIEVVVYLNPVHADFLASYEVNGHWRSHEDFKRRLVALGPTWDFNYVNSVTRNRRQFIDPSHFKPDIGRRMVQIISAGEASPRGDFGVLLTKGNLGRELKSQRERYDAWVEQNPEAHALLKASTRWGRSKRNDRRFLERGRKAIRN